jgi:NADPH:quinone reductase
MKAAMIREFGPASVLRLEDVSVPEPSPGEILTEVHAVSVNRTLDIIVRAGGHMRLLSSTSTRTSIRFAK